MDYLSTILKPIQREFDEFKAHYSGLFSSSDSQIDTLLKFLLERKGKSMRPILVLLVAACSGKVCRSIYNLASSVELLHQGSLIHDDVVDESAMRRGKPSVNQVFDNRMAVLLGDYVVSQALQQITATGHLGCLDEISKLIGTLSHGEIIQISALDSQELSEQTYFEIISKKTAYLFSVSAKLSAILSGFSESDADAFTVYAYNAGLCFQIMDDILDYHPSKETGKPHGNDLREGKFTLPSIYALSHSERDWSSQIRLIRSLSASSQVMEEVTEYTISHGGIEYSVNKMAELKQLAMNALPAGLPSELRSAFQSYMDLITDRIF